MVHLEVDISNIKRNLEKYGDYIHAKTGNIYSRYGLVIPVEFPDQLVFDLAFLAHCCENKEVDVVVYKKGSNLFFIPSDNSNLYENTEVKVLYEREGVFWLRSSHDFSKPVIYNGVTTERFYRLGS